MQFNSILFPAPLATYSHLTLENVVWIPRSKYFAMKAESNKVGSFEEFYQTSSENGSSAHTKITRIPCHFQKYKDECRNTIIYLHANAEDLGLSQSFVRRVSLGLEANVLTIEYPGYGVYQGKPCVQTILEDAEYVFDFLIGEVGLKPEEITILGRSVGSGPAIHLASHRNPRMLLLISPFTSIQDVVKDIYGSKVSHLVADKFGNYDKMANVKCPCYFIHGQKDTLIHPDHSRRLISNCKAKTQLHSPDDMTHNSFKVYADIIEPFKEFFEQQNCKVVEGTIEFPKYVVEQPSGKIKPKKKIISRIVTIVSKHNKF